MMRTIFSLLLLPVLGSLSCEQVAKPILAPERIFASYGLEVINSFINQKQGTITVLYGNTLAKNTAMNGTGRHVAGEVFTAVTWKQKPMPHWYGTNMNGGIETIETISIIMNRSGGNHFKYIIVKGREYSFDPRYADSKQRINFIVNQKASVFP